MPYVGDLAKGVAWTLEGVPTGSSITVMTITKNEKVANVDLMNATESDPARPGFAIARGTVWNNAARVSFRVNPPLVSAVTAGTFVFTNGAHVYSVPSGGVDTAIVGDAK